MLLPMVERPFCPSRHSCVSVTGEATWSTAGTSSWVKLITGLRSGNISTAGQASKDKGRVISASSSPPGFSPRKSGLAMTFRHQRCSQFLLLFSWDIPQIGPFGLQHKSSAVGVGGCSRCLQAAVRPPWAPPTPKYFPSINIIP